MTRKTALLGFSTALCWRRSGPLRSGGAIHTRVQLVSWLLFPARLAGSEGVPVVTARLTKTGKYRINSIKGKEVLIEMEIFFFSPLAENAPQEC